MPTTTTTTIRRESNVDLVLFVKSCSRFDLQVVISVSLDQAKLRCWWCMFKLMDVCVVESVIVSLGRMKETLGDCIMASNICPGFFNAKVRAAVFALFPLLLPRLQLEKSYSCFDLFLLLLPRNMATTSNPDTLHEDKGKMVIAEPEITNIADLSPTHSDKTIEVIVYRKWTSKHIHTRQPIKY
ncbi:hypothetical protein Tco_0474088 [Tanacetum coccineum]